MLGEVKKMVTFGRIKETIIERALLVMFFFLSWTVVTWEFALGKFAELFIFVLCTWLNESPISQQKTVAVIIFFLKSKNLLSLLYSTGGRKV